MSVYSKKGKGWRYDFTHNGTRFTEAWFKTKLAAKQAEAQKREELKKPETMQAPVVLSVSQTNVRADQITQTDTDFLTLVNRRLDSLKHYCSESHFMSMLYHARRWTKEWKGLYCSAITEEMIEAYVLKRSRVSHHVANKELQYLRALFNFGIKKKMLIWNPTTGLDFLPVSKNRKYVPPKADVMKAILHADPDTQDYLWTILLTAGRVSEINNLTWDDVNLEQRRVTLWTRKSKHGNRISRDVPMIDRLHSILSYRYGIRDHDKPWVFWHSFWSRKANRRMEGPYKDRKKLMTTLCRQAAVRYFRYHALRHLTASVLDDLNVPMGVIQRILGHQNRRTTEIYLHSIGESEKKAMSRLNGIDLFAHDLPLDQKSPRNGHKEYWYRKAERPSCQELKKDIADLGFRGTGRKYGVSDNAVRKWLKRESIQSSEKK